MHPTTPHKHLIDLSFQNPKAGIDLTHKSLRYGAVKSADFAGVHTEGRLASRSVRAFVRSRYMCS